MKGLSIPELKAWQPPQQSWIIQDILAPKTKMMIHGRFMTWKSMLTLDMAAAVSTGRDWFGYKTHKSPVYSLQIEMPQAELRKRVLKYEGNNKCPEDGMWLCTEHYIKLDKGFGVAALEKELARTKPGVLIVDPLYRVVSGHLTDEWDMRQFMDRMDLLINTYNLGLVIVHHDKKYIIQDGAIVEVGADNIFGSSMFIDWLDASVQLSTTGKDGEIIVNPEKLKYVEVEQKPFRVNVDRKTLTFKKVGG